MYYIIQKQTFREYNYENIISTIDRLELDYEMIDIFQLADVFVMDVGNTEEGYKIIECGCINCVGFYDANLGQSIFDLENHYRPATNRN